MIVQKWACDSVLGEETNTGSLEFLEEFFLTIGSHSFWSRIEYEKENIEAWVAAGRGNQPWNKTKGQ